MSLRLTGLVLLFSLSLAGAPPDRAIEEAAETLLRSGEPLVSKQSIDCPADFLPLPNHPQRLARKLWLKLNTERPGTVSFDELQKYVSGRLEKTTKLESIRQPAWEVFLSEGPGDFLLGNEASAKWMTEEMEKGDPRPDITREALLRTNRDFLERESQSVLMHLYLKAYVPTAETKPLVGLESKIAKLAVTPPTARDASRLMRQWVLLAYPSSIDLSQDDSNTGLRTLRFETSMAPTKFDFGSAVGQHLLSERDDDWGAKLIARLQRSARFFLERETERIVVQGAMRLDDYFAYPLDLNAPPRAERWRELKERLVAIRKSLAVPSHVRVSDVDLLLSFEAEILAFRRWAKDVGITWETAHVATLAKRSGFLEALRKGDPDTARRIARETPVSETPDPNTSPVCSDKGVRFRDAYVAMLVNHFPDAATARGLSDEFEKLARVLPYTGDVEEYGNRLVRALESRGKKPSPETVRLILHTQTEALESARKANTFAWQTPFNPAGVVLNDCLKVAYGIIHAARRAGLPVYGHSQDQVVAQTCPDSVLQTEAHQNALILAQAKRHHDHQQESALVNRVVQRITDNQALMGKVKKLEETFRDFEDRNLNELLPDFRSLSGAVSEAHDSTKELYLALGFHRSAEIESLRKKLLTVLGNHLALLHPLQSSFAKAKLPVVRTSGPDSGTGLASLVFLQYRDIVDNKLYYNPKPMPTVSVTPNGMDALISGFRQLGQTSAAARGELVKHLAAQAAALGENDRAYTAGIGAAIAYVEGLPAMASGATPVPLPPDHGGSVEAFLDVTGLTTALPKIATFANESFAKLHERLSAQEAWNSPMGRAQLTAYHFLVEANELAAMKANEVADFIVQYPHRAAYEGLGFIPGPGVAKGLGEAASGTNIFGDKLTATERGIAAFAAIPFGTLAAPTLKALKNVSRAIGGAKNLAELEKALTVTQAIERAAATAKLTKPHQVQGLESFLRRVGKSRTGNEFVEGLDKMVSQYGAHLRDWRNHYRLTAVRSADEANQLARAGAPKGAPFIRPYEPGTKILQIRLSSPDSGFVRFHGGSVGAEGRWIVREADVRGLSATQVKEKLGLPKEPSFFSPVHLPRGTSLEMSETGVSTGVTQFRIMGDLDPSFFKEAVPLK